MCEERLALHSTLPDLVRRLGVHSSLAAGLGRMASRPVYQLVRSHDQALHLTSAW